MNDALTVSIDFEISFATLVLQAEKERTVPSKKQSPAQRD